MSQDITLKVSDKVIQHASMLAARKSQRLEEVLVALLETAVEEELVEDLPDEEVLALAKMQISGEEQEILSELLSRNREGELSAAEKEKLDELMAVCDANLLLKAEALRVAVKRELIEPLQF